MEGGGRKAEARCLPNGPWHGKVCLPKTEGIGGGDLAPNGRPIATSDRPGQRRQGAHRVGVLDDSLCQWPGGFERNAGRSEKPLGDAQRRHDEIGSRGGGGVIGRFLIVRQIEGFHVKSGCETPECRSQSISGGYANPGACQSLRSLRR
jgi:hypothetical protein